MGLGKWEPTSWPYINKLNVDPFEPAKCFGIAGRCVGAMEFCTRPQRLCLNSPTTHRWMERFYYYYYYLQYKSLIQAFLPVIQPSGLKIWLFTMCLLPSHRKQICTLILTDNSAKFEFWAFIVLGAFSRNNNLLFSLVLGAIIALRGTKTPKFSGGLRPPNPHQGLRPQTPATAPRSQALLAENTPLPGTFSLFASLGPCILFVFSF